MSGNNIAVMRQVRASAHTAGVQALDLLPLPGARPAEALARARAVLAANPDLLDASVAHQVVGIVMRDAGDVNAAIQELRTAFRLARAARSAERQADVLATLGVALVQAGRSTSGQANLDAAVGMSSGVSLAQVLMRRGPALWILGRHNEALADLRRAYEILRRSGDAMWEARVLTWLGLTYLAMGATERADANFESAARLWASTSQDLEVAYAIQNRALVASHSGNLPLALSYFDEAAERYDVLDVPTPDLAIDRCVVLLAAGLPQDALDIVDTSIQDLGHRRGAATKRAELLFMAATAALAAGEPNIAQERVQTAQRLFRSQHRTWWHARADLVLLRARYISAGASGRLLRDADATAGRLESLGSDEASQARLVAGRIALDLGRAAEAEQHLGVAARARLQRKPAQFRLTGWLAEALRAEAAVDQRRLLNACNRGLDLLDEQQLIFGASELRAQVTAWGAELAELAQRSALRSGRPRLLLSWSERWRATALAAPAVRPVDDHKLQADLTAARDTASRLEKARAEETPIAIAALEREQLRLERLIRARVIRTMAGESTRPSGRVRTTSTSSPGREMASSRFDVARLLAAVGDGRLIQIVDVAGSLHVLICGMGRVRHVEAGTMADAAREVTFARFGLHRLARAGRSTDSRLVGRSDAALAVLDGTGRRLEEIVLGTATRYFGDGPVVVVPPGRLHAVPWALLPSLRDHVVSVAPSARAWLRARAVPPPDQPSVVLVRGPGSSTWGAEVPALSAEYADATVLGGGTATAALVLEAMDGASLVHIAAHGTFRADSPMFSSLHLDDGPLTVHDLERLHRAPYRIILPSCDSALRAPAGADELLGLASSLVPLGTAGIAASVVPVNDKASAEFMIAVHRQLRRGGTLAESLRDARAELSNDPVQIATGWSFIALGAV